MRSSFSLHAHREPCGRLPAAAVAVALCCIVALPARGQRVVPTIDIGGSRVRYADSLSSSAATLTPAIRVEWDQATLGAAASFSQFAGGWSTQGGLDLSLYTPALGGGSLFGEVSASTGGSAHEDGMRTGESIALVRAHAMKPNFGTWAGAGAGVTWDGGRWNSVRVGDFAAWLQGGAATTLGSLRPTRVADSIRYMDAELALRLEFARVDLGLTGGHRTGDRLPTLGGGARSWASLTATTWVAPAVAIVASGGSYPVDFTQGYPGGRFVTLGVRIGARTGRHAGRAAVDPGRSAALRAAPEGGVEEFHVLQAGTGRLTIRVRATRASSMEIAGDFTAWRAARLTAAGDGWWSIVLPIARGTHEVNLRVDGRRWIAPPGLVAVDDEFGGTVGLLQVR